MLKKSCEVGCTNEVLVNTRIFGHCVVLQALLLFSLSSMVLAADNPSQVPQLMLAKVYQPGPNIRDYWVSEKLDGVRAYWNGSSLRSRRGNVYVAPEWFTSCFPSFPLDGELWLGRGKFEELVSIVRKRTPENDRWQQVKYMVFDLPKGQGSFTQRLAKLRTINLATKCRIQIIKQWRVNSTKHLDKLLNKIVKKGGEGLMLHRATATYRAGRTGDLLKMKPYLDAEAKVLGYSPGKGKYINKLGAIVVETEDGKKFKIGSGFSDADRESPPPSVNRLPISITGKQNRVFQDLPVI